jgi:diadenosine tetraphosphatase ApaH/serine/threonine PP2A family protein phosphatase
LTALLEGARQKADAEQRRLERIDEEQKVNRAREEAAQQRAERDRLAREAAAVEKAASDAASKRTEEERRIAELRSFAGQFEECRHYAVRSCEAALRSLHATEEDRKNLFLPVADTFHEFDNYDLTGLDLRHFKDTTQTACSSACDVESQCKAYSFDKWNRMCFLKGTVKIFRLEPNTVSGLRPGSIATPVIASEAITIQRYRNKAFPWKGQQTAGASSYDECEERCKQDPACVALTFFKNTELMGKALEADMVVGIDLEEFSPDAAAVVRWTRTVLLDENRAFLERLEPRAKVDRAELFHASPRDPVWEYVISEETALAALEMTVSPLVLVGHSHVALSVSLANRDLTGAVAPDGTEAPLDDARWLLNPGSVGQPRDGDPRAAWLELDFEARTGRFHRVSYDIGRTQSELRERDLPEALAERLAHGV